MTKTLLIKVLCLIALALTILIPLSLIQAKISERAGMREEARVSIANSWTGNQTLAAPMLAIHYEKQARAEVLSNNGRMLETKHTLVADVETLVAEDARIEVNMKIEVRYRGLQKIPVYTSEIAVSGKFDARRLQAVLQELHASEDTSNIKPVRFFVAVHDPRGLGEVSKVKLQGAELEFEGGANLPGIGQGLYFVLPDLKQSNEIEFSYRMSLRGMSLLSVWPSARELTVSMQADWPHPKFQGAFLPAERQVSNDGFEALWSIQQFSSNAQAQISSCVKNNCSALYSNAFGVDLIEPIDIYTMSERAVKYGLLFVCLVFIGLALVEVLRRVSVHPVQYGLIAAAKACFFLLLLSLAEHIGFASAYLLAALASLALLLVYLASILNNFALSLIFSAANVFLYWLLYMILQSEDYALLMGALLCFAVLAGFMLATRRVDWYQLGAQANAHQ